MKMSDVQYRMSRMIQALQWKLPLWALFVCAGAAFFIPPFYLILMLLVIAYGRSWYKPEHEAEIKEAEIIAQEVQ